jgi:guanylate kinase
VDESGKGFMVLVTGPSGAGKSTLLKWLMDQYPRLGFSVSCTTRTPREGEVDGRDYFFISHEEFERRRDVDEFVEWAEVHGHYYGTLASELIRSESEGRIPVLEVDVQGGVNVIKRFGDRVLSVFVFAPSMEVLEERLRGRGTDDEASIARRLADARGELEQRNWYRFWLVNDDRDRARADLRSIFRAEELRRERWQSPPIGD